MTGVYANCALTITDHAGLSSEPVVLPNFVWSDELMDFCNLPAFDTTNTISKNECLSLVSLYVSTDGDHRTNNTNRLETTDVEQRFGVRTGEYEGERHVDGLFLHKSSGLDIHGAGDTRQGNNLVGTLADVFDDLPFLRDINFSRNTLVGNLPASLGSLQDLIHLFIVESGLTGEIPTSFAALDSLQILHLKGNHLDGALPDWLGDMV